MADDSTTNPRLVSIEHIEGAIRVVRGHRVIFDSTLAALYEVEVEVLNQAVRRNSERFPHDSMFRLTGEEAAAPRSQTVTLEEPGRGRYRKYHRQFHVVFDAIRELMRPPVTARRRIGYLIGGMRKPSC